MRLLLWLIALLPSSLAGGMPSLDGAYVEGPPIPIFAFHGPSPELSTPEQFSRMRAAGFTYSWQVYANRVAALRALDAARQSWDLPFEGKAPPPGPGIRLFPHVDELETDTEGVVRALKDHPALGGYSLGDEPSRPAFERLGELAKRVQAIDPDHPCYLNLVPNYAGPDVLGAGNTYRDFVEQFIDIVPVQILTFDHYPLLQTAQGLQVRGEFYENLEIVARAASKAGKPFWAFALTTAHGAYPVPDLSHLRLQVYSNLAYGAQGIEYFTYWTPAGMPWDFHDGPLDSEGRPTPTWDVVRRMNEEIQKLSGVFMGARVLEVGHTGATIPLGTQPYRPVEPIRTLETGGAGAAVSLLENHGRRFLVIVNRSPLDAIPLTLQLTDNAEVGWLDKDCKLHRISALIHTTSLAPGDATIVAWQPD